MKIGGQQLVILGVLLIFVLLVVRGSRKKRPGVSASEKTDTRPAIGAFKFEMPLSEHDRKYINATFDDAHVYYYWPPVGEIEGINQVIGSYRRSTGGDPGYIFLNKDGEEIGEITDDHPDYITLSRRGVYDRFLKNYGSEKQQVDDYFFKVKFPNPASELIGKIYDAEGKGYIYDVKTDELIGSYVGNKYGAACALCAMTEELHDDTPYHKFLYDWDKLEIKYHKV